MDFRTRGNLLFILECAEMLQELDNGNKERSIILRLLTPILKLFTAKECMWVMSEGIEMFGALGYLEDSSIPRIARDAQVTPIWEGTTNTLVHDFLFTLAKDKINLTN